MIWILAICAVGIFMCAASLIGLYLQAQSLGEAVIIKMEGLNAEYMNGFAAHQILINKLEDRVKKLEAHRE
jgi:hypothetical protein